MRGGRGGCYAHRQQGSVPTGLRAAVRRHKPTAAFTAATAPKGPPRTSPKHTLKGHTTRNGLASHMGHHPAARPLGTAIHKANTLGAMGKPTPPAKSLLIVAAFSRYGSALDWAQQRMAAAWGPIARSSPRFPFTHTRYYEAEMGCGLVKQFFAFADPIDPATLAQRKLAANAWEEQYAALEVHPEARPLNLDPGYLTLSKLVLASTKDFAHRVYIGQGIYAEITLLYRHGRWEPHEWTFPDYRQPEYHQFFTECRRYLHTLGAGESRL